MKLLLFAVVSVAVLLAACSASSGTAGPGASATTRIVEVTMYDELRFEPDAFSAVAGETVTFRVHNAGQMEHEFYIGDRAAQDEHEAVMAEMGMAHDDEQGIGVEPGDTGVLTYSFAEAGELLIGCHEPGHYAGGMRATIDVEP